MELTIKQTLSKRVEVVSTAAEGEYAVRANVNIDSSNAVNAVENGTVTLGGVQKANFSQFSTNNKNVNFQCESTEEEKVLAAINEFVTALSSIVTEE